MQILSMSSVLVLVLSTASCTITREVQPIAARTIDLVCIQENPDVRRKEFGPTLQRLIEEKGFATRTYQGNPPADCNVRLEYSATWSWDLATYMDFADVRVFESVNQIGRATYDARRGSATMRKFGSAEERLRSLLDELFAAVTPAQR